MDRLQEIRENVKRDVAASEGAYSDRAWLLGEYDRLLALLDQAQKAALHAQDHCLQAQERAFKQAAYAELNRNALAKLVHKLHECEPHINNAFVMQQLRGGKYTGPNYADELAEAEHVLAAEGEGRDTTWVVEEPPPAIKVFCSTCGPYEVRLHQRFECPKCGK